MKPKEQLFSTFDSYEANLADWILAIRKLPSFVIYFNTCSKIETLMKNDERIAKNSNIIFQTDVFDQMIEEDGDTDGIVFQAELTPPDGNIDFEGFWVSFKKDNKAYFSDYPRRYQKYFKENGIKEGKLMTWQEAYDKLCELARKEQNSIPKLK